MQKLSNTTTQYQYTQLEVQFVFHDQRSRYLGGVEYQIIFISENNARTTYKGITDANGLLKPITISENGQFSIAVKGSTNLRKNKGQKSLIKPLLAEDQEEKNPLKIENNLLQNNQKFITEQEYELRKKELKQREKEQEELVNEAKNLKTTGLNGLGDIIFKQPGRFSIDTVLPLNTEEKKLVNSKSYKEFKKLCTVVEKKQEYIKFKNYSMVRIMLDNQPAKGINYQVFSSSSVDSKPLLNNYPKPVDQEGYTGLIESYKLHYVKVKLGSQDIKSPEIKPITCVDDQIVYEYKLPVSGAYTNKDKNNEVALAQAQAWPIVVNPHTNEFLILSDESFKAFKTLTNDLAKTISDVHETRQQLNFVLEGRNPEDIEELERRLNINQQKAADKLNQKFKKPEKLREVLIYEKKGEKEVQMLRRYLSDEEYNQFNSGRLNHHNQFNITDPRNRNQFSPSAVNSSIEKIKQEVMKQKLPGSFSTDEYVYDIFDKIKHETVYQYQSSHDFDVSIQAQWLRLTAGCKGDGSIQLTRKGVAANASIDGSASLVACEGVADFRFFVPSPYGWNIQLDDINLGRIRFVAGCEFKGYIGASVGLTGNVGINVNVIGTRQVASAGITPLQHSNGQRLGANGLEMQLNANSAPPASQNSSKNGASAKIEAFAGVNLGFQPSGEIQWYDHMYKEDNKFVTLAKASVEVAVSAGAGVAGEFTIIYDRDSGKFKFRVAAHYCWGVGAKGAVEYEVETKNIQRFLMFLKSQLLYAGFKYLSYVCSIAFSEASKLVAYCIGENKPLVNSLRKLSDNYADFLRKIENDQNRKNIAMNTNSEGGRKLLTLATPDAKGILVYAVTHWSDATAKIFDCEVVDIMNVSIDYFTERKKALINIFKTCITTEEWTNVLQHVDPNAKPKTMEQISKIEGDIIRFLSYGNNLGGKTPEQIIKDLNKNPNSDHPAYETGNYWVDEYLKYRNKAKPVAGYPMNYKLVQNLDDPRLMQLDILKDYRDSPAILATNLNELPPFEQVETTTYTA